MRIDGYASVVEERVRSRPIARHHVRKLRRSRGFLFAGGMGSPRLWALAAGAALDPLEASLNERHDSGGAVRLREASDRSRRLLATYLDGLLERLPTDTSLGALMIDSGELHLLSTGACRGYLLRRGEARRLSTREESEEGLLGAPPALCSLALEPADLILAGSTTAFSARAIGKVTTVIREAPDTPAGVLASLLTEPASRAGLGAVAVAIRIL
ncbi:MAG: hypothetical protein OEY14_16145 [Myxococcales bacterium]|nr:hypothetical protein [Myxococcales bacterium]